MKNNEEIRQRLDEEKLKLKALLRQYRKEVKDETKLLYCNLISDVTTKIRIFEWVLS